MGIRKKIENNKDILLNILSHAIYLLTQQVIIFPYLANFTSESIFSDAIYFLNIVNILSYVFAVELGNTRLVMANQYKNKSNSEFFWTLTVINLLCFIIILGCLLVINFSSIRLIFLSLLSFFMNFRLYGCIIFRMRNNYTGVVFIHVLYFLGALIGIIANYIYQTNVYLIFVLADLLSFLYLITNKIVELPHESCSEITKEMLKKFSTFSFNEMLGCLSNRLDRLVLLPLLGSNALVVYFSITTMSKVSTALLGPINTALLARLSSANVGVVNEIFLFIKSKSIIIILLTFVVNAIFSFCFANLFYHKYTENSLNIILISSAMIACRTLVSFYQIVFKRFYPSFILIELNGINIISSVCFGLLFGNIYGLTGFSCGLLVSSIILLFASILIKNKIRDIK